MSRRLARAAKGLGAVEQQSGLQHLHELYVRRRRTSLPDRKGQHRCRAWCRAQDGRFRDRGDCACVRFRPPRGNARPGLLQMPKPRRSSRRHGHRRRRRGDLELSGLRYARTHLKLAADVLGPEFGLALRLTSTRRGVLRQPRSLPAATAGVDPGCRPAGAGRGPRGGATAPGPHAIADRPDKLATSFKETLSAWRRSSESYDFREAQSLGRELEAWLEEVTRELASKDPSAAVALFGAFIESGASWF